jgi:hypothetical protein
MFVGCYKVRRPLTFWRGKQQWLWHALQTLARAIFNQPLPRSKGISMSTDAKPKGKGKSRKSRKSPIHFTPEFQRWARGHVSSESCAINGAKGFSATLAKHGPDVAFRGARQWRLDHPSSNELLIIGILSQLRVAHEREYRLGASLYTLDFTCPQRLKGLRSTAAFTHSSTWRSESVKRRASAS